MNNNPNQYQNTFNKIYANRNIENKATLITKLEKFGYKSANFVHKLGVLTLFGFICFNIGFFIKEYNSYWRSRRVII